MTKFQEAIYAIRKAEKEVNELAESIEDPDLRDRLRSQGERLDTEALLLQGREISLTLASLEYQ